MNENYVTAETPGGSDSRSDDRVHRVADAAWEPPTT